MKRSRQELSIDMFIHRGISKNNQTTLSLYSTFIPKKKELVFSVLVAARGAVLMLKASTIQIFRRCDSSFRQF